MHIAALTVILQQQPTAAAVEAGTQLIETFRDLLVSLIGASLTERLLRSTSVIFLSSPSAPDHPP